MTNRSDDEIRADRERLAWVTDRDARDMVKTRLVNDIGPLLDRAVAAERENEQLRAHVEGLRRVAQSDGHVIDEQGRRQAETLAELAAARRVIASVERLANEGALGEDVVSVPDLAAALAGVGASGPASNTDAPDLEAPDEASGTTATRTRGEQ